MNLFAWVSFNSVNHKNLSKQHFCDIFVSCLFVYVILVQLEAAGLLVSVHVALCVFLH